MIRSSNRRVALALAGATALAATAAGAAAVPAAAHGGHQATAPVAGEGPVFLVAALRGRNEVPVAGGPAAGDPDGRAVEFLRIQGDRVSFAVKWQGIGAPTAGHVHLGAAGVNGAVEIPFFGKALPDGLRAATGSVAVHDPALLAALRSRPEGFYANLHTARFPGGAVRGQFHALSHGVDLAAVLRGGPLAGVLDGGQEVPAAGGAAAGDQDGHAAAFVRAGGSYVDYSLSWSGTAPPTAGHLHRGRAGVNGPVAVPLFAADGGLPESFSGVAGRVAGVDRSLTGEIRRGPAGFYANLHTAQFPGGAVRGQLFGSGGGAQAPADFEASVVRGVQIYACTRQADGSWAYTQHDVRAALQGGIRHSFVKADAGPPRWAAPDGSAVTGRVLSRWAHGAGNVPELDLAATAAGARRGLLADAVEVLRLNTVGGTAPAGGCDPQRRPVAEVPYQADYLFVTG